MANYAVLKAAIEDVIKTNGNNEITGELMQQSLIAMINSLGAEYQFAGVATIATDPGTPDHNVFYIAGYGLYTNFGETNVPKGCVGIFMYNGNWTYNVIDVNNYTLVNVNDLNGVPTTPYQNSTNARLAVGLSTGLRRQGQIITYLLSDGWHIEQYIGDDISNWTVNANWIKVITTADNGYLNEGVFNLTSPLYNKIFGAIPVVGWINSSNIYIEGGTGYLLLVNPGDVVTLTTGANIDYYAFLQGATTPYKLVSNTTRVSVSANTTVNVTIPEGCSVMWVGYQSSGDVVRKPVQLLINGEDAFVNLIDNKHIIYGNDFATTVTRLSDVTSVIPKQFRKPLAIMQWRNTTTGNSQISFYVSQSLADSDWNNESYWRTVVLSRELDRYSERMYPLYFSGADSRFINLRENIVLSNNGDSLEVEVICGEQTNQPNGYGFMRGAIHSSGVGVGLSCRQLNVRADDGTHILSSNSINYVQNKWHYKFAVKYQNDVVDFYVDDTKIHTYSGQKTVTINGIGNGATYGNWIGTILSIKVNGDYFDPLMHAISGDLFYNDAPNYIVRKESAKLEVFCKYDDNLYIRYPIIHATKAYTADEYPSFYDNWGLRQLQLCYWKGTEMVVLETLFRDGEAEMAIEAKNGNNDSYSYVCGSTHGFENIQTVDGVRTFSIQIDGKAVGETDTFSYKGATSVELWQKSELVQPYTNSNPFAEVIKKWIFRDKVEIKSSIKFTRSIAILRLQQGMFCVYRHLGGDASRAYLTNRAIKDDTPYLVYDTSDGWESVAANDSLKAKDHDCNRITEYGDTTLSFAMQITDDNRDADGGMNVSTNNSSYNKIYYTAHSAAETVAEGKEYHATQEWIIE